MTTLYFLYIFADVIIDSWNASTAPKKDSAALIREWAVEVEKELGR